MYVRTQNTIYAYAHIRPHHIEIQVYPELKEFVPKKKGCEVCGCDMKFAKERVITFTDGVLCIAATLVFVNLPTPDT